MFCFVTNLVDLNHDPFKINFFSVNLTIIKNKVIEMLIVSRSLTSKRFLNHFSSSKCLFFPESSRNQFHTSLVNSLAENHDDSVNNDKKTKSSEKATNQKPNPKSRLERLKSTNLLIEIKNKQTPIFRDQIARSKPPPPLMKRSVEPSNAIKSPDFKPKEKEKVPEKRNLNPRDTKKERDSDLIELARLIDKLEPQKVAEKLMEPFKNVEQTRQIKTKQREPSHLQREIKDKLPDSINKYIDPSFESSNFQKSKTSITIISYFLFSKEQKMTKQNERKKPNHENEGLTISQSKV
jgi:hypothetical protein